MKRLKGIIYGESGVGKSVFSLKAPKPFYICSDDNYTDYLVDCGARVEDHVRVYTWSQFKRAAIECEKDTTHETIVIDLFDDLYKWAQREYAKANGREHISDFKDMGKSYDIVKADFQSAIERLLSIDKNIILLMHEQTSKFTDKFGSEYARVEPSIRVGLQNIDFVTSKLGFCLRAFAETKVNIDGDLKTTRYLSLSPSDVTEWGNIRGVDVNRIPRKIELDWDVFVKTLEEYKLKPIVNRGDFAETPKETRTPSFATAAKEEPKRVEVETPRVAEKPKGGFSLDLLTAEDEVEIKEEPKTEVKTQEEKKMSLSDLISKLDFNK